MEKAFLCHSSQDKQYVRIVANRLGRSKVVFDEMSFDAGHDFRVEIERGLNAAALFAFFVSRASLKSLWCRYELDEAHFRKVSGEIRGQIAIIIDPQIAFSDLPPWMQRLRAIVQPRPVQAAREIERELFAITPAALTARPFIGRQSQQKEFIERLAVPMELAPHVFVVSGLEGVGRRSYLSRAVQDNLGLTLGPFRILDPPSTLDDLFVWLVDETSGVLTRAELVHETSIFRGLDEDAQLREISERLRCVCEGRFMPCLIDRGALLDEKGEFKAPYRAILESFASTDGDHYLAVVDTRAPQLRSTAWADRVVTQRIEPLNKTESRLLLQQMMRRDEIAISASDLNELNDYIDGYPPAAYFVTRQAKTYGVPTTVADKSLLTDFKAKRFTRFLTDLNLLDAEWNVLTYLASEQLVPLTAMAIALNRAPEDIAQVARKLIDNSLVVVVDENLSVSPPIRDAVIRARGHLTSDVFAEIRDRLTQAYWLGSKAAPTLEVVDATLHAVARSGATNFEPYRDLLRPSIVHRMARESYHRQEWKLAREYADRAQQMGANNADVRSIYFKALVRLEDWLEAERKLEEIKAAGDRQYLYLKAFMLRRHGDFDAACGAYQAAIAAGDSSVPVRRDFADCLNRLGRYREATAEVRSVLQKQSDNIFVLDLALRIYLESTKSGVSSGMTANEVERYLKALERFDLDRKFIHHRKAALLAHEQRWLEALSEAEAACAANPKQFEAFVKRCDILIELNRFDRADEELGRLGEQFAVRRDVQRGLRVKLLIRQGRWRDALAEWNTLDDKQSAVHRALLLRIREAESQDSSVSLTQRKAAIVIVEELRRELSIAVPEEWLAVFLSDSEEDEE